MPCQVRDETYIKVKGKWTYYYRAVDKHGKTLDFMLSEKRDEAAATAFFTRAIGNNGFPDKVVIDKSGANLAGLQNMNCLLILNGWYWLIEILQVKYLNNIIEHTSHRCKQRLPVSGPQVHQETDEADEGVQILPLSLCNIGRHRNCAHDPQAAIRLLWPVRIPTIRGICWITVSNDTSHSVAWQSLRQNLLNRADAV